MSGHAASGGALDPETPRATRIQPESIRTVTRGQFIFSPISFRLSLLCSGSTWFARKLVGKIDTQSHGKNIGSKNMKKIERKKTKKKRLEKKME